MSEQILETEIQEIETEVLPAPKKKRTKYVEPSDSPFLVPNQTTQYYGSIPKLITYGTWINCLNIVKNSEIFKTIYKNEFFKFGDLEETCVFSETHWLKPPEDVKNFDGIVVDTKPGILDPEKTLVLPPKFFFQIYRRYLLSQPGLDEIFATPVELMDFPKYRFETKFPPRPEQAELGEIAEKELKEKKYFRGIVQAPPGWGKGVFNDTIFDTPSGTMRMGDIKVNDIIFGKNGKPTKVIGVYPQGEMDLYKFTFGDSTTTVVDETHLWEVWDTDCKKWRTLQTKEILSKNYVQPEKDKRYKYFIPLCEPVEYDFDNSDPSKARGLTPIQHKIDPYGMGRSLTENIPYEYLYASIESRELLLQGILDINGYMLNSSCYCNISSVQFQEDICKLARSLGHFVTVNSQDTNYEICINYTKERKAITKIEKIGTGETTCIKVDAPDSLFLINDFIVTHNTFISIYICSKVEGQTLIIVPNKLLEEQWANSIIEFTNLTMNDIGFIKGSNIDNLTKKGQMKKPILIALIQSIDSQIKRVPFEKLKNFYASVSAVFFDETHTSGAADGYGKVSSVFSCLNIVGLSATPYKKDKNLFQLYTGIGQIKYISTHQNLIPNCNMHLLPVQVSQKDKDHMYRTFEQGNWAFFLTQLEEVLFKDHWYFMFLAEWALYRFSQGHSTVILFKTNKMLEKLQRYVELKAQDLKLEKNPKQIILTSETAKKNKQEVSTSDIVFSNYKMFSAGADFPHLSTVFFASMVLGKIPIIQTLGRTTRKYSNKIQDVQAHFFLPEFIYPLFSNNEPHLTIMRAVKTQYPTSQFKWDKGFNDFFERKKKAAENLMSNDFNNFHQQQHQGQIPETGKGPMNGSFLVNDQNSQDNRLVQYQQYQQYHNQQTPPVPPVPPAPVPPAQNHTSIIPVPPVPTPPIQ